MTTIHSNGSRWYGQAPATIDELIVVLSTHEIEKYWFAPYNANQYGKPNWTNHCPISVLENGNHEFFGNFSELSHVFRIETNEPEVIQALADAIQANEGWKKYYKLLLVDSDGNKIFQNDTN